MGNTSNSNRSGVERPFPGTNPSGTNDRSEQDEVVAHRPQKHNAQHFPSLEASPYPPSSRVRFSEEIERNPEQPRRQFSSFSGSASSTPRERHADELREQSVSKTRDRGYSLRRSLFTQNIQRQNTSVESSSGVELSSTANPKLVQDRFGGKDGKDGKDSTGPAVITVEEREDEEDKTATSPVRLSDPALDLPRYSQWMKRQRMRNHLISRITNAYKNMRRRLKQAHQLPPSADGRHVTTNVSPSFHLTDERTGKSFIDNSIRSCRYTPWNFVPKQLVAQFGKLANFYFLCVSVLQMIPDLSTTGTYTTIVPLLIFVGISMAKEGYDDIRRYRLDKEENRSVAFVLDGTKVDGTASSPAESPDLDVSDFSLSKSAAWTSKKWQDIEVGNIIRLERDDSVPADIVLLNSSGSHGAAYIETKSLDGETDLKTKKPLGQFSQRCRDDVSLKMLDAEFVVEDPNLDLYRFDGKATIGGQTLPLTNNEIVYRGSTVRNTNFLIGVVVYSGEECKIRMNANKSPRVKAPALQGRVNRVVVIVACLVLFIGVILTICYEIWRKTTERSAWYLTNARVPVGHILTSFIIMFNTMLPLSLYVSLEICKVAQMFMMNDIDMYDATSDTPMEPRTSTLNEELGQVSYIFSDKTGTLTNNSMRFRKMSIAGTAWLHDRDLQEEAERTQPKLKHKKRDRKGKATHGPGSKHKKSQDAALTTSVVNGKEGMDVRRPSAAADWQPNTRPSESLHCGKTEELLEYIYNRPQTPFSRKARLFLLSLALCHTCIPEKDDDGEITFQASSPDELALVTAAQDLGFVVTDRQSRTITVKTNTKGDEDEPTYEKYEVLDVIEFSSARKRMSVVVRMPDSRICLFCKGADSIVRKLLRLSDLAAANVGEIQRQASIRKSLEAREVIRRRSTQVNRTSLGALPASSASPKSSVPFTHMRSARASIDAWLKDRESEVDMSVPRRSNAYYSPRPSGVDDASGGKHSVDTPFDSPRASFQSENMDQIIDEKVVLNERAIFERCFQHIDDFATEGSRTLLYGHRFLSEEDYQQWKEVYNSASTSLTDRQEKMEKAGEIIERQLELLGATAIEDKLQEGVPDAIDRLRRAGIKMWMLTGDKRETAINIGHSCRLIKDYSTTIVLDSSMGNLPSHMTSAIADVHSQRTAHSVLVIDGQTLAHIDADPALRALFIDLAIAADSVICCRASPSQKASLVKSIRTKVKGSVTLAIGDGANDIAMIQEAHLGIGIAGREGLQAARTSDYSIAQFRFLLKLLLVHGRWNYVRVCKYTLGTFWKEMLFYLVQAVYQRWTGYTGTSLYEPWSLSMFNTLFTSLPVIFMGVFEKDLSASTLLAVPELYAIGRLNQGFSILLYAWWAFLGVVESVVVYFIVYTIYGNALFTSDPTLFAFGSLAFTACVILISLKMQFFELHNKSITALVAIVVSSGGWFLWNILLAIIYDNNNNSRIHAVKGAFFNHFGRNFLWWTTLFFIVITIGLLEISIKAVKMTFFPSDSETFQAYERDLDVKRRFEESAADLLQQGWDRGSKKPSLEIVQEEVIQAQREAEIQEILDRPRTMETKGSPRSTTTSVPPFRTPSYSSLPVHGPQHLSAVKTSDKTGTGSPGGKKKTHPIPFGNGMRKRQSWQPTDAVDMVQLEAAMDKVQAQQQPTGTITSAKRAFTAPATSTTPPMMRRSFDVSDLFSIGYGEVRKGSNK